MRWVWRLLPFLILALAVGLLYRELEGLRWQDLVITLKSYSPLRILGAFGLLSSHYFIWAAYDWISLRQLEYRVPYVQIFRTTSVAFPISNLVGYSLITGFATRATRYLQMNLTYSHVTQLILFNLESWWMGFFYLTGISLTISPITTQQFNLTFESSRLLGIGLLAFVFFYWVLCWLAQGRTVRFFRTRIFLPDFKSGLMKVHIAALDIFVMMLTLYVLMPGAEALSPLHFAAIFCGAQLAGVLSFVPAGLGVLEAVLLLLLKPYATAPQIVTGLILYRIVHFLVPVAIAVPLELFNRAGLLKNHPARRRGPAKRPNPV